MLFKNKTTICFALILSVFPSLVFSDTIQHPPFDLQFTIDKSLPDYDLINRTLSTIPAGLLMTGCPKTWKIDEPRHWHEDDYCIGVTKRRKQEVLIRRRDDKEQLAGTVIHETGHCIWTEFSKNYKDEYKSIWLSDRQQSLLVSDYAYTNEEEGFCEALRVWLSSKHDEFVVKYPNDVEFFNKLIEKKSNG